ncbi:MAG: pyridoxamine 5'-phosphate oxidase [Chloroflexi bacterium]|nr:pyridoxamine 5'-phosphate oxidase [Chloroflexota bacterium]
MTSPLVPRPNPFMHFAEWYRTAQALDPQPEAAALATVGADGAPSNRLVLVRQWSIRGFEFFTNLESRKARDLATETRVALTWHWKPPGRQVRVEGLAERTSDEESDAYWRSRPRGSQISAIASAQSMDIEGRVALLVQRDAVEARYAGVAAIPRPAYWGGIRVVPLVVEFWQHEDDRYHQRLMYERAGVGLPWSIRLLQP